MSEENKKTLVDKHELEEDKERRTIMKHFETNVTTNSINDRGMIVRRLLF